LVLQVPDTQIGALAGHCALVWHVLAGGLGTHAPLSQVEPVGQAFVEQSGRHWPLSQTSPAGHWLEYWQAFEAAVQVPPAHVWPGAQSAFVVHAQGPRSPPQVGPESVPASTVTVGPLGVAVGAQE
jgi:hypothetical protein